MLAVFMLQTQIIEDHLLDDHHIMSRNLYANYYIKGEMTTPQTITAVVANIGNARRDSTVKETPNK